MLDSANSVAYKMFNLIMSLNVSIALSKGPKYSYLFRVFIRGEESRGL